MRCIRGDLFSYLGSPLVIPTNQGWTKAGMNVMGRGVAREAANRYPILPELLGTYCMQRRFYAKVWPFVMPTDNQILICFPVKPLRPKAPQFSWNQPASLSLIRKSVQQLAELVSSDIMPESAALSYIYLPLVGCGNGGLSRDAVLPILEQLDNRFILVEQ